MNENKRNWAWWLDRTLSIGIIAVAGGIAAGPISDYAGIEGWGLALAGLLLIMYWWLNVARPVLSDKSESKKQ